MSRVHVQPSRHIIHSGPPFAKLCVTRIRGPQYSCPPGPGEIYGKQMVVEKVNLKDELIRFQD